MSSRENTLHFAFNPKSGHGEGEKIQAIAQKLCAERSWRFVAHEIEDPKNIEIIMKRAADAAFVDGGILAAAGGDGTLRAAVQAIAQRDIRFAAIPGGTFNLFARTHSIPENPEDALKLIFEGTPRPIRIGQMNDQVFLINANLGLYAKAIHARKAHTRRWGRHRIVALLSTVTSLLKGHPNMHVRLQTPDHTATLKTPMIFIGNNVLQLENLNLDVAKGMQQDLLAVFVMKPFRTWDMIRILFRGLAKNIDQDPSIESFNVDSMEIQLRKKHATVSLDGEMFHMTSPFQVKALPKSLLLMKAP
jgi:diacylglycerol kinase family enzyme